MYSELFWLNFHEVLSQFRRPLSDTECEHVLWTELKSDQYRNLVAEFKATSKQLPEIWLTECALFDRKHILVKNNAVELDSKEEHLKVCTNYLMSKQHLKEEFAREITLAKLQPTDGQFACAMVQACRAELNASGQTHSDLARIAVQKCANF